MAGDERQAITSPWPGRVAWRAGRRLRATVQALVVLVPLAALVALLPRTLKRLQTPRADEVLAAVALLALPLLGWLVAYVDGVCMQPSTPRATQWSRALREFWRSPTARTGAVFTVSLAIVAVLAPVLAPYDPLGFVRMELEAPTASHWLGTDEIGRDVLSRLLYGTRISLAVGVVTVALSVVLGTLVGLVAGYAGGLSDAWLMRLVDLLLAFPRIFLVLLIIALWGPSIWLVIVVLGLTGWMGTARLVRAQVLSVRETEYVQAALVTGVPTWRVLLVHILPNTLAPMLVSATLMVGNTILAESTLSFLGLGVQVPTPSWGAMLNEARASWRTAWWLATFPGAAITITVVACNLVGDGLRDVVDPRSETRHEV